MCQKYILHIDKCHPFPFKADTFRSTLSLIRVTYQTPDFKTYQKLNTNIKLLLDIKSSALMRFQTIKEIRGKCFIVDYQQVSERLCQTSKFNETSFIAQTKCKVYKLFQQFAEKGIKYFPTIEEIGLDGKGEPKLYVRADFEEVEPEHKMPKLLLEYQIWNEKLFQSIKNLKKSKLSISSKGSISQYSQNFDKILNELELKIQKKRKFKTRKWSQSKDDRNYDKTGSLISPIHLKRARNSSFSQINHNTNVESDGRKRQRFFCQSSIGQKSVEKVSESTKEDQLCVRICQALCKTKTALRWYEKCKKKRT